MQQPWIARFAIILLDRLLDPGGVSSAVNDSSCVSNHQILQSRTAALSNNTLHSASAIDLMHRAGRHEVPGMVHGLVDAVGADAGEAPHFDRAPCSVVGNGCHTAFPDLQRRGEGITVSKDFRSIWKQQYAVRV